MANEPVDILPGSLHPDDRIGFTSEAPRSHLSSAEIEQPYRDMAQALEKWSGATNAVAVPLAERQAYADLANQKITRDPSGKIQVLNPANSVMFGEAGQRYNEIVRKGTALQAGQMLDLGMVEDASRNMLNPAGFNAASDARIDKFQEEFGHTPWGAQAVMHGRERQIEHLEGITNRAALNDVQNNKINLEAQIKSLKQDLLGLAATPGSENSPQFKQLHDSLYSYLDSLPANPLYHTPKNLVELEKKQFETEMAGERVASSVPKLIDEQGLPAARKSVDDFLARGDLDPAIRRQVGASMRAQLAEATPKWREADQGYSISVERAERAMGAHTIDTPGNPTSEDVRNLIAAGNQRGYSATPRLIADADAHGVFKAMGRLTPAQRAEAAGLPEPAAGNLFFGDSIAEGYRTAAGAQGDTKVGRPPKEVLQSILGWSGPLKGQSVDLSTGLSNSHSEADFATVEKQIEALRARGVEPASIQVRGVGDRPDLAGVNDRLAKIAKDNGATFLGPLQNLSPDRVHPASYSGSAHPASAFANPGPAPSSGVIGGPGYAEYKARTAQIESGGGEGAVSSAGATGKYQFMPATLAKYGGGEEGMDRLTNDNWKTLRNGLGRNPTWAELYLAHQQGAQGALHLMAEPNRPAAEIVGVKAVTGNGGTADMTAGQFVRMWETTFNGAPYRPGAGTETAAAGAPHYSASEIAANPWLGAAIFQGESDPESKLSYFNAHLSVADRGMKLGDLPDRQQWADIETLHAAHAGDPRWEEKYSEVKGRLDATLAERLPPAEQAAWKSNVAAVAGGQGDPYIKAQATSAQEYSLQLDKQWKEDPYAMAQRTGMIPALPRLDPAQPETIGPAVAARVEASRVIAERRPDEPRPPLIPPADAPAFTAIMQGPKGGPALIAAAQAIQPADLLRLGDEKTFVSAIDVMRNSRDYGKAAAAFAVMGEMNAQNSADFDIKFHDGLKDLAWWDSRGSGLTPQEFAKEQAERHDPGFEEKMRPFDKLAEEYITRNRIDANAVAGRIANARGNYAPGGETNAELLYDWKNDLYAAARQNIDMNTAADHADQRARNKWKVSAVNGGVLTAYAPEFSVTNPDDHHPATVDGSMAWLGLSLDRQLARFLGLPAGLRRGQTNAGPLFYGSHPRELTQDELDNLQTFMGGRRLVGDWQTRGDLAAGKPPSYGIFLQDASGAWFPPVDGQGQPRRIIFDPAEAKGLATENAEEGRATISDPLYNPEAAAASMGL